MPVLITPSSRTAALWGGFVRYPAKLEATILLLCVLSLPFITAFVVQKLDMNTIPESPPVNTDAQAQTQFNLPGPPSSTDVAGAMFLYICPLVINSGLASFNIFWCYSLRALHPVYSLVMSILLMLFWATDSVLVTVAAIRATDQAAKNLGFSVPVAIIGAMFLIGLAVTHLISATYSVRAVHRLRTRGLAPAPTKSEYASEYGSFAGSRAGSTRHLKLFHTPTRDRFSSEFSSHVNSPIQRDEEDVRTVRDIPRSPGGRGVTAIPGVSAPPMPAVPLSSKALPSLPAKSPTLARSATLRSVKSAKSAPGPRSPLSPKSPKSPLSPRMPRALKRSATTANSRVERKPRRESAAASNKRAGEQQSGFIGCRERGMSLEGKAKRELQRMKLQELDTKRAEKYRSSSHPRMGDRY